jgi:photosystem II stability/assembly factor-like uncharacterized protein
MAIYEKKGNDLMKILIIVLLSIHLLNAQWIKVELPNTTTAQSFWLDGNTLYVGGDKSIFYTDDGKTWHESSNIGELYEGVTALIKTGSRIFIGSFTHGVYESTDNGDSWIHRSTGLPGEGGQMIDEFVVRGNYLYAATLGEGVFVLDLNNPAQWSEFRNGLGFGVEWTINSLHNYNDTLIAGAGANASVHINIPGSNNWDRFPVDIINEEINSMLSITSHNGVIHAAGNQAIYRSTDNGISWEKFNPGIGLIGQTSYATYKNTLFVNLAKVGRNFIYSTTDNGVTWSLFDDVHSLPANDIEIFNNRIYAGRFDGLWYYPLNPTDVIPDPTIPDKLILEQNYPNPFNPSTKISWQSTVGSWQTLKVYDMLGNEIATLVNEYKPAGYYEVEFNSGLELSSGVYLYKLNIAGAYSMKKMILMK